MSTEEITRHPRKENPVTVRIHHGEGRITEKHTDGKVTHREEGHELVAKTAGNPKEG